MEALIVLALVGLILSFCFDSSRNIEVETVKPEPKVRISTPTIFKWSSRGGCFAESDFYFELRTDNDGASWIALLKAHGSWYEGLLDDPPETGRTIGAFVSSGRLGPSETNRFIEKLRAAGPLEVKSRDGSGAVVSFYVKLGNEENKVDNIRGDSSPDRRMSAFTRSGLISQQHDELSRRYNGGDLPDAQPYYPAGRPGPDWLTHEDESIFSLYPEKIPTR